MMCGMRLLTAMVVIVVSTFSVQEGSAAWDQANCTWNAVITPIDIPENATVYANHDNTSSVDDCKVICQESSSCVSIVYDAGNSNCSEYSTTLELTVGTTDTNIEYHAYTCTGSGSNASNAQQNYIAPVVSEQPPSPSDGPHINNNDKEANNIQANPWTDGSDMQGKPRKEGSDIMQDKPRKEGSDMRGKPKKERSDMWGKPRTEGGDIQDKPRKEGSDMRGKPRKEGSDMQDEAWKEGGDIRDKAWKEGGDIRDKAEKDGSDLQDEARIQEIDIKPRKDGRDTWAKAKKEMDDIRAKALKKGSRIQAKKRIILSKLKNPSQA